MPYIKLNGGADFIYYEVMRLKKFTSPTEMPEYVDLQVAEQDLCQGQWSKFFIIYYFSLFKWRSSLYLFVHRVGMIAVQRGLPDDHCWTLPPCLWNFLRLPPNL